MSFCTFDADRVAELDDPARFRFVSREELPPYLGVAPERVAVDLGSGTGFLTDEVTPHIGTLYAVDVQAAIHNYYCEKGAPNNVESITADAASLPLDDDHPGAVLLTVTYREFTTDEALAELARVVRPSGTVVVADWPTFGSGEDGPP